MDRNPGRQQRSSLRASDADRERFVEALRQHHVEGRLTTEELAERTEQAYAAKFLGDLDALATDLPPLRPPAAAAPGLPAGAGPPPYPRPPGRSRAAAKAALFRTVLWFGMISVLLLVIWAMTGADYFWPVWPILGFLFAVGWQVFNLYGSQRFDDE
jgi:Domain of unknown function (DUF1707)/2TM domain